jgi:Single-strand binding protein family
MAGFADINHWQLTGRMARDAEVQESNGRKRLRLRVAVHESGPESTAHFFTVVAFDQLDAAAAARPVPARRDHRTGRDRGPPHRAGR